MSKSGSWTPGEQVLELSHRCELLENERDAALAERDRLRERERHFAKLLSVADGGQYQNDWEAPIERVVAERRKWAIALQSLTPGGSEFQTPEACVAMVRQRRDDDHRRLVAAVKARKAAENALEQARMTARTVAEQRDNCAEVCERLEARLAEAERMLADAAGLMRNAMSYADALTSGNVAHQRGQILGSLNFYVPRIDAFLAAAPVAPPRSPALDSPAVTAFFDSVEADFPADPLESAPPEAPDALPVECPPCEGSGEVWESTSVPGDEGWRTCSTCDGTGKLPTWQEIGELRQRYYEADADKAVYRAELAQWKERFGDRPESPDREIVAPPEAVAALRASRAEAPTPKGGEDG